MSPKKWFPIIEQEENMKAFLIPIQTPAVTIQYLGHIL